MIYARDDVDEGLDAIMFPVRKVNVHAETETDLSERIPGRKAWSTPTPAGCCRWSATGTEFFPTKRP